MISAAAKGENGRTAPITARLTELTSTNADQPGHPAILETPAPTKSTNRPLCAASRSPAGTGGTSWMESLMSSMTHWIAPGTRADA